MSRIRRHVVRRDKARSFMDMLEHADEDTRPLDAEKTLLKILKDIPAKAIRETSKQSPYEWETIHLVMQSAFVVDIISEDMQDISAYFPLNLHYFRSEWLRLQKNKLATIHDYKQLLSRHSILV